MINSDKCQSLISLATKSCQFYMRELRFSMKVFEPAKITVWRQCHFDNFKVH